MMYAVLNHMANTMSEILARMTVNIAFLLLIMTDTVQ